MTTAQQFKDITKATNAITRLSFDTVRAGARLVIDGLLDSEETYIYIDHILDTIQNIRPLTSSSDRFIQQDSFKIRETYLLYLDSIRRALNDHINNASIPFLGLK